MKLTTWVSCLLLSTSAFAYNQQEITALINQQTHKQFLYPRKNNDSLNWQTLQGPRTGGIDRVISMKGNDAILFAFNQYSHGKVYQSIDAGLHWKQLATPNNAAIYDLISVDENHLLLAAGNKIYISSDKGEHWALSAKVDYSCNKLFALNPNLIFLITNFSYDKPNLYRSLDGGKTWTPAKLGLESGYPFFTIDGRDNILLTNTDGVNISTNNGLLWTRPSKKWNNVYPWSYAVNSKHDIFMAYNGMIYKTNIDGTVWEEPSQDLNGIVILKVDFIE
jgi:photosystem II stability/assembly factor-like uncharacterized protein